MNRSPLLIFAMALVSYSAITLAPELPLGRPTVTPGASTGGRAPASEALLLGDDDQTPATPHPARKPKVTRTEEPSEDEPSADIPACGNGWQTNAKLVGAKFARFLGVQNGLRKTVVDEHMQQVGGFQLRPDITLTASTTGGLLVRMRAGVLDLTESAKACMSGSAMKVEVDNSRASGIAAYAGSKIVVAFSSGHAPGVIHVHATIQTKVIDSNFAAGAVN